MAKPHPNGAVASQDAMAQYALERLAYHGADTADVMLVHSHSLSANCRMGKTEMVERAESQDIGLRAIIGQRQAFASATGIRGRAQIDTLAEQAVAMAKSSPPNRYCGLADAEALAKKFPTLELYDSTPADPAALKADALAMEAVALDEAGIVNSEGASANWGETALTLATSHGFFGQYQSSHWGRSCIVLAGKAGALERDYASHRTRFADDLEHGAIIAKRAARRAKQRLGARKIPSQTLPVIYDQRVAPSLMRHFASAINGATLARGTSFLNDALGTQIFPTDIQICDDPHRARGLGSTLFDGEGLPMADLPIIHNGMLENILLDCASAKQLDMQNTARAGRSIGAPPSPQPSNFYMAAGTKSVDALCQDIGTGFYVTELIGMGVNLVTGDYSRGAVGQFIENGERSFAVHEVTLAGNLRSMFASLVAANDLEFRSSICAPSLLIADMTLAGV